MRSLRAVDPNGTGIVDRQGKCPRLFLPVSISPRKKVLLPTEVSSWTYIHPRRCRHKPREKPSVEWGTRVDKCALDDTVVHGVEAELDRIPRRGDDSFGVEDQSAVADGHEEGCTIAVGGGGGRCGGGGDCGTRG
ncbi:MAG: hypothetical protein Q9187_006856, partial [Circinaria calcarea]